MEGILHLGFDIEEARDYFENFSKEKTLTNVELNFHMSKPWLMKKSNRVSICLKNEAECYIFFSLGSTAIFTYLRECGCILL
jgi:hypothetical protein